MPTVSDRLNRAQQNHNAVITIIPFDEHAVDLSPTLKGLPVAFKDIVDVAYVPTTCGSKVKAVCTPVKDAPVVQRLTAQGALPVAKANLQEFSYGILGDASAYGRVINPRDPEVCGGGSSSGSAALVACGALDLTVGSDSAGSVRVPAACQGVLGFKPTFGLIPVEGVFPFAPSFDCIGFFASSVDLIEQAFIATTDEEPTAAQDISSIDVTALKAKGERFAELLAKLETSDFALSEGVDLEETIAATAKLYEPMRLKEVYDVHRPLLDQRDKYQDVILQRVLGGEDISQENYDAAAQGVEKLREEALALLADAPIILTPTLDSGPLKWSDITPDNTAESAASLRRWTEPFNVLGWPAITVPLRGEEEEGVGDAVQVVGQPGEDLTVLRVARALQALL
ncbi:amidase [Corynebacterium sp. MSK105]|uniref:amidase n=1 Tax=unclassified Corynebacterium TaxID=2624378 RepID=UPI00255082D9|nr:MULTISPECIES: amidase [unclassified Corynebacterium]MDK8482942.1 amidase [Corynebacterium sp. MSK074]MDK8690378.1 amidase [Corynebacterium sp. MSK105]